MHLFGNGDAGRQVPGSKVSATGVVPLPGSNVRVAVTCAPPCDGPTTAVNVSRGAALVELRELLVEAA